MNAEIDFGQGIIYMPFTDKFFYSGDLASLTLERPLTLVNELLYGCNLHCGFCMKYDDRSNMPTLDETSGYLDRLSDGRFPLRTVISGGEPFLRPDIRPVLRRGYERGQIQNLVTNGIFMNPDKSLAEFVNIFEIALDGSTREIYQLMRGTDAFTTVVYNITMLVRLGATVRITYLLTKKNVDSAKEMPSLCDRLGVTKLRLQRFIRYGRGANSFQTYELSDEELVQAVAETKVEANRFGIELRTPPVTRFYYGAIFITPHGDIVYRNGAGDEDITVKLGNLTQVGLTDVWTPDIAKMHKQIILSTNTL
jgi:MoaA/NifB/PqqE/SkfB family radical SAM enzyme